MTALTVGYATTMGRRTMKRVAELEKLRAGIDDCDEQIRALLHRRVTLVRQIASAKVAAGLTMHDAQREADILTEFENGACEVEAALLRDVYHIIFQSGQKLWRQVKVGN